MLRQASRVYLNDTKIARSLKWNSSSDFNGDLKFCSGPRATVAISQTMCAALSACREDLSACRADLSKEQAEKASLKAALEEASAKIATLEAAQAAALERLWAQPPPVMSNRSERRTPGGVAAGAVATRDAADAQPNASELEAGESEVDSESDLKHSRSISTSPGSSHSSNDTGCWRPGKKSGPSGTDVASREFAGGAGAAHEGRGPHQG